MSDATFTTENAVLRIENLTVTFRKNAGPFRRKGVLLKAVENVSFHVHEGETFGLIGESGSGKTTVGKAILNLVKPSNGRILFEGVDLLALKKREIRELRKNMQMVFQDPKSSLNPRFTIKDIIAEPLVINSLARGGALLNRVEELLELVGLDKDLLYRLPHELSGGQRQRVSIARALSLEPKLLILDEPTSALDVSVQALILELLLDLQEKLGLTYLLITHDMSVVRYMSDRIAVMSKGRIMESGSTEDIFNAPRNSYTMSLMEALTPF